MARSFNGSTDQINVSANLITGTPPFSLFAWALPASTSAGSHNIFGMSATTSYGVQLRRDAATWNLFVLDGGNVQATYASGVVAGQWTPVGAVWDGTNINLYVGGVLRQAVACTGITSTGAFNVWGSLHTTNQPWDGSLAEGAIWHAALTAAEMAALALGRLPRSIRPQSLVHYLPMWGLSSPEPDLSGSANNGTLTGTAAANHAPVTLSTRKSRTPPDFTAPAPPATLLIPPVVYRPPASPAWFE